MKSLELVVPDDVYALVGEGEIQTIAREALVVRLYELEKIGSGRAAQVLEISRREFLTEVLSRYGVFSFDENVDVRAEAARGVHNADNLVTRRERRAGLAAREFSPRQRQTKISS